MNESTSVSQAPGLVIYAKDKDKVANFYKRVLNLETVAEELGFALLQAGSVEIAVVLIPEHVAIEIEIASPPKVREDTPFKPWFLVQNFERTRVAAVGAGGQLKPANTAWRWRGAVYLDGWDPEGNVFQLRQNNG